MRRRRGKWSPLSRHHVGHGFRLRTARRDGTVGELLGCYLALLSLVAVAVIGALYGAEALFDSKPDATTLPGSSS